MEHGDPQTAVVEVTTGQPIAQSVTDTLSHNGLTPAYRIHLKTPESSRASVKDAAHARAMAIQVGQVCQELCGSYQIKHIHLFVAAPIELAVLVGHQLNALCPITVYEFKNDERIYKAVGILRS
jgi:hypothetical protein